MISICLRLCVSWGHKGDLSCSTLGFCMRGTLPAVSPKRFPISLVPHPPALRQPASYRPHVFCSFLKNTVDWKLSKVDLSFPSSWMFCFPLLRSSAVLRSPFTEDPHYFSVMCLVAQLFHSILAFEDPQQSPCSGSPWGLMFKMHL
jgi:hypothetical protein